MSSPRQDDLDQANITAYSGNLRVDHFNKAIEIKFWSMKRPHMRAFYVALFSMFVGIYIWFSVAPLQVAMRDTVTGITQRGLYAASLASVTGSMISRLAVGVACDAWGARKPMVAVLIIGSVATGLTSMVQTDVELSICRFFSGISGSTLVSAQFWISSMFGNEIIGTATSIVLGIGYAGSGFGLAFLGAGLLPLFANIVDNEELAWRVTLAIPAVTGVLAALIAFVFADDTPKGPYNNETIPHPNRPNQEELQIVNFRANSERQMTNIKGQERNTFHFLTSKIPRNFRKAMSKSGTWILAFQYAMCAGTNAALLNINVLYFTEVLDATNALASAITSAIGWLAVTCFVGGYCSDKAMTYRGLKGRCIIQFANLATEGSLLLILPFIRNVGGAATVLVLCSTMATWATGSTFAVVPYVDKSTVGSVFGIVAFMGNFGSILFIEVTKRFDFYFAFISMAILIWVSAMLTILLRLNNKGDNKTYPLPNDYPSSTNMNAATQDIDVEKQTRFAGLASTPTRAGDEVSLVPVIDLSVGSDDDIAKQLVDACKIVGFFTVVGHGIPQEIIDAAFRASETFFAMSLKDKETQCPFSTPFNSGFEHKKQIRPATGLADQKESFHITARKGCMDGRWPTESGEFKMRMTALMEAAEILSARILNSLEQEALPNIEARTLSKSHNLWGEDGQCCLRLLHYPAIPDDELTVLRETRHWRCGAHTDWTNLSLLFQRIGEDGLECCANPRDTRKVKQWTSVPPVEGGIAVNIGTCIGYLSIMGICGVATHPFLFTCRRYASKVVGRKIVLELAPSASSFQERYRPPEGTFFHRLFCSIR